MKKLMTYLGIFLLALAVLALGGCGGQGSEEAASSADGEEAAMEYQRLSDPDAAALAARGYELYIYVARGGSSDSAGASRQTVDGMDYRPLGSDLATEAKLMDFLGEAFTGEAIFYFMETTGIREIDGQLYQPDADGGSILDWSQATAVLYIDDIEAAQFDLQVPSQAEEAPEMTTIRVNYAKEGDLWKIASNPAEIY